MPLLNAYGLAALSGVLYFLAFAGFDCWPLAFVALSPLLFVLDRDALSNKQAIGVGLCFGFVTNCGGYYWLIEMLERFSGFPFALCLLLASVVCLYQGGQLALFVMLCHRAKRFGWSLAWVIAPIYAATELAYPLLFPSYYANCFHDLPGLIQVVDLGGPSLLSALALLWNGALFELLRRLSSREHQIDRRLITAAIATLAFTLGYGVYRIHDVDARTANAPKRDVGIVQADMGIFQKRQDPTEGQRRHIEQSLELEKNAQVDLLIWPESALVWSIPEHVTKLDTLLDPIATPLLFGGISRRHEHGKRRIYNTAFMTDAQHNVVGTYDKTYLLAFGEYLPFGETFPWLYDVSPNTGRFTPGIHQRALAFDGFKVSVLVCYEDVLPTFTRSAVQQNDPHLLVNITNDSWFGDTHEPWIHLALAKFRAVEHHRFLARATNSGVSAIIDASGRVVTRSGTFERASLHADVAMLTGTTLYGAIGDWPGWLSLCASIALLWRKRR